LKRSLTATRILVGVGSVCPVSVSMPVIFGTTTVMRIVTTIMPMPIIITG
jgi:hypothetical protein